MRLALEPFVPARDIADESVGAFFRRRFGAATVGLIAEPLLGGIHAGDIESLSLPSLFPRFADAERHHRSVLRSLARNHRPGGREGMFRSLSSGMGELVAAIERRLPAGFDSLRRAGRATRAPRRRMAADGGRHHVPARALILAAPAPVAARLLSPHDPHAAALCAEVPYVSTVSIALGYPRAAIAHPLEGSGFVVARQYNRLRITACTWVSSKWSGRAPSDQVLLRVFAGGVHDPDGVSTCRTIGSSIPAWREIGGVLGISTAPDVARVYRWRHAGAQHNVGQRARMTALDARLGALPGVFVAGSGFRSIGIPDCIADGRAAAVEAAGFVAAA